MFIKYLTKSPSSPFLKMLAVLARKEYQSDVGNLSHIHLLGKLAQMCEHSREDLGNLIRNNIVDIIKPEEVDAMIDEGLINHKDDVNQVQIDGKTYIIHRWNSRCLVPDKDGNLI